MVAARGRQRDGREARRVNHRQSGRLRIGDRVQLHGWRDLRIFTAPHVATLGLTKGVHIPHDWLVYAPGFTTKMTITNDTLTGFMSGCPILYYRDNGVPTVAHVGTSNEYPQLNPAVKSTIKAAIPPGATGFNPAGEWSKDAQFEAATTVKPPGTPRVVALVTTTGAFYSILLVQKSKPLTEFIVAGIKQVRAKTGGELDTLLT